MVCKLSDLVSISSCWVPARLDLKLELDDEFPTADLGIVHKNDQSAIEIIAPNLKNGPWIAGGAVLAWYNGTPTQDRDIDVWCKSEKQLNVLNNKLNTIKGTDATCYISCFVTENAITYTCKQHSITKWKIQLIKKLAATPLEVINRFDFTVCQLVTDGSRILCGENTLAHIKNKTLAKNTSNSTNSISRLIKYWSYGFEPEPTLLDFYINNSDGINWEGNINNDAEYSNI